MTINKRKRKGERIFMKRGQKRKNEGKLSWRGNNQGMGTVEMILIIVEIYTI